MATARDEIFRHAESSGESRLAEVRAGLDEARPNWAMAGASSDRPATRVLPRRWPGRFGLTSTS